jgi:hypothetical protein
MWKKPKTISAPLTDKTSTNDCRRAIPAFHSAVIAFRQCLICIAKAQADKKRPRPPMTASLNVLKPFLNFPLQLLLFALCFQQLFPADFRGFFIKRVTLDLTDKPFSLNLLF